MTAQSTEIEDRHELPDIAARILMATHDGKDLTRKEWGLLQCAALNYLNEAGIAEFRKLYEIVKNDNVVGR